MTDIDLNSSDEWVTLTDQLAESYLTVSNESLVSKPEYDLTTCEEFANGMSHVSHFSLHLRSFTDDLETCTNSLNSEFMKHLDSGKASEFNEHKRLINSIN